MQTGRISLYSKARWFATVLVAAVLIIAFYKYTKEFTAADFRFTTFGFQTVKEQTLEDGYLVVHEHKLDPTERIAWGREMGFNVIQMPRLGFAYFEKEVPGNVINRVVAEFERNTSSYGHWRFYVSRDVNWIRFSGLIVASILAAIALAWLAFRSILTRVIART